MKLTIDIDSYHIRAKTLDGVDVKGAIYNYQTKKGDSFWLMLHENKQGTPTVSKVDPNTFQGVEQRKELRQKVKEGKGE